MAGPEGATIFYTLDGSDPRLPGGLIAPSALTYSAPAALANAVTVKARSRNLNHRNLTGGNNPPVVSPWSGLTQARFSAHPPAVAGNLLVTEIHYNPAGPSPRELAVNAAFQADDFEFIELKNTSPDTLDLYGVRFRGGIEFAFAGSVLETSGPGNFLVLARNRSAFETRYGRRPQFAGEFNGSLDNNGERLKLTDADGTPVFRH